MARAGARFLVIGGFAVRAYCPSRAIAGADVDLLIDRSERNAALVVRIVCQFELVAVDPKALTRPKVQWAAKRFLNMDIVTPPDGTDFETLWEETTSATINAVPVRVISLDAQRHMKENAGRGGREAEKDAYDLALLAAVSAR